MDNNLTPVSKIFSELIIEIFRLNRKVLDAGDQLTQNVGLSSARWQVLGVVEHGPVTVPNVAREMGLTRQAIQQIADILVSEGFINYQENPHHRRAKLLVITSKGRSALDEVQRRHAIWANEITCHLSLDGLAQTLENLKTISQFIDGSFPALETYSRMNRSVSDD